MNGQQKFEDYEGFVEKFKPKKTTDDCITPPEIYEVIKDWACRRYDIDPEKVVRPFWPGGDYKAFDYSGGKVVIDNPPFSILSQICKDYLAEEIPFFLFAPALTLLSGTTASKMNHLVCDALIIYENGANVKTSFVTSYGLPTIFETCPELTRLINEKNAELQKAKHKQLPKYSYPDNILTSAMGQKYAKYGIRYTVAQTEATFIRCMDSQRDKGKTIYGSGLLLSSRKAAEKAVAEKAVAEKAAVEKWELSEREKSLINMLDTKQGRSRLL